MMEESDNGETKEYTINIPSNQSMITMTFSGISESDALGAANQIPVGDIFSFVK
ncbi:MAG: hypothetical protein AAGC88_16980 [Bacteroidota bacterium]